MPEKSQGKGDRRPRDVYHGRAAGDAGVHKEDFPGSTHQRRLVHVGRNMSSVPRRKDRQVKLGDFKSVYSAIGGGDKGQAGPILGEAVANLSLALEVPRRAGVVLVLPLPKAVWRPPFHLERG